MQADTPKNRKGMQPGAGNAGVALVLALIMLSVLVILIGQFQYSANVDARIAENYAADRENYYAARGALNLANAILLKDLEKNQVDTFLDDWADSASLGSVSIGRVLTVIEIKDQERFLNINRLSRKENPDYKWMKESLARLVALLGMDSDGELNLAERIADWIDEDSDGQFEQGARNAPLTTVEEMLQIPGVTNSILYGHSDEEGEESSGLAKHITLWGAGRVNINTAPELILRAISDEITQENASDIIEHREENAFNTGNDLVRVEGLTDIFVRDKQLASRLTVRSSFFEISIEANKGHMKMRVMAIVERKGKNIKQYFWKERQV